VERKLAGMIHAHVAQEKNTNNAAAS